MQFGVSHRFTDQLYADDLVVTAECQQDLQVALDAVSAWGHSVAVLLRDWTHKVCRYGFWASKGCPSLFSFPQWPRVALGLRMSLSAHARHLVSRGNRLFAQCVAWCKSERLPLRFASTLFMSYVLPSISWGVEFLVSSHHTALQVIDRFLLRRCLQVLPTLQFSWNWDGLTLFTSAPVDCSLSLAGCTRCLRVIGALSLCLSSTPCFRCLSLGLRVVFLFVNLCAFPSLVTVVWGLGPLLTVCGWFRSCARTLDQCLHERLFQATSALSVSHVDPSSSTVNCGRPMKWCTDCLVHRTLVLGVWPVGAMILFLKVALHDLALPSSCPFCDAPHGDMFHCLSECAAFSDLREQWCRRCSVHPDSVPFWVLHPWLFNPTSSFNTFRTVLAHVTFIGQACERCVSL